MVAALLALLALVGAILLILLFLGLTTEPRPQKLDAYDDAATAYVEALDTAIRIQEAAREAEQQIYAAAIQRLEHERRQL